MKQRILLTLCCALVGPTLLAQTPINNRAPRPDEIGYRPADGTTVRMNPPSLTWLHETATQTYTVQWSRRADFSDATTTTNLPFNVHTHSAALAQGQYFWRYRFTGKEGKTSGWSVSRSFTVPADAIEFPMPTRAQQRERVPQAHPRLFMRPEDLPRLRELAKGRDDAAFARLRAEADRYIADGPTPEPEHLGSATDKENKELIKYWWPNRTQTEKACREAETIAFVSLLSGEKKYGEAARKWILHLASWNPDGPTNFRLNCEAGKPMLYRLPRAYDWAWDTLTEADREKVQTVMLRRAQDAWISGEIGRGVGHLNRPFSSHGNRTWHKLAECAIAFLGEIPEAETWLDYAVNKFYAAYPVWSDDDGGWHEGISYWGGYMNKAVTWLQFANSALGIDGFKKPFFAQVGDYPLYVAPPGSPNMGFSDLSFRPPPQSWGGFIEYFLRAGSGKAGADESHAGYWRWWTQQWQMRGEGGLMGFLYNASLPPLPPAKTPTDLPPSKIFHGIGVASLHTTLLDSADDVHLLFKSSPFGSQSHGHNPQNSFQLNAYGESLLTTCVYRDLHGSKFHTRWAWSTVAHNAVLVDGEGQIPHSATSTGRIVHSKLTPEWDYVEGDALAAYGGKLTRARRKIAFVKPDLIVICDDLAAPKPVSFQFMLHAFSPFTVDEAAARLTAKQPKASVTAQYLSPAPLNFRQWDGYNPPPDREFPNQWHLEAGTREKLAELRMLTVIVPERAGKSAIWRAERLESETAVGARVLRDGKTTMVLFRNAGQGAASFENTRFDSAVMVAIHPE
ncbi:MAG: DUF4962 domain-containing protein [Verrucomicrobia bacterium]|nr:DUF4962 domain-containing protein [Verrucomicrobiota bacterium]